MPQSQDHVLLARGRIKQAAVGLVNNLVVWLLEGSRDDNQEEYASYQTSHSVRDKQSVA